jgi:hypothetical protein
MFKNLEFSKIILYNLLKSLVLDRFIGYNRDIVSILEDRHVGARQVAHDKIKGSVKKEAGLMDRVNAIRWERAYVGIYNVHETYRGGCGSCLGCKSEALPPKGFWYSN